MTSELTLENLAELEAAAQRLERPTVPPKDSMLKLVEKQKKIKDENIPLEVDDAKVAERIKQASENSGITFTDLARGCDVSDKVVWQWAATGKISKAKLPMLARLCDVSVTWLLTGQEQESLFQPTADKHVSKRSTAYGEEQTTYFPRVSQAMIMDRAVDFSDETCNALAETNSTSAWVHKVGVPGIRKFSMRVLTGLFWNSPDHTHPMKDDSLAFATDLIPVAGDIVIVNVGNHTRAWGYLKSVGGFLQYGSTEKQFNAAKHWRVSRARSDDISLLGDIVFDDLKLVDVVAVCISLRRATTPRIEEMYHEDLENFTLDDRRR